MASLKEHCEDCRRELGEDFKHVHTGPKIQLGGFHAGFASSAYQPPVLTKTAVADALKVSDSQPIRARALRSADFVSFFISPPSSSRLVTGLFMIGF